jgi:DNA-binding NarL/FixJ family response regulator
VQLNRLTKAATEQLARSILGPTPQSVCDSIWLISGGRPKQVLSTIRAGIDAGTLELASRDTPAHSSLTRRELQVALLAAAGLTNREIAERLATSPRTVGNQLQRVFEKLGVRRRTTLGVALRQCAD